MDLDTGAVVAAEVHLADRGDTATMPDTLNSAAEHLNAVDATPTPEAARAPWRPQEAATAEQGPQRPLESAEGPRHAEGGALGRCGTHGLSRSPW